MNKEIFKTFKVLLNSVYNGAIIMNFFIENNITVNERIYVDKTKTIYPLEYSLNKKLNKISQLFISNGADISNLLELVIQNEDILGLCFSLKDSKQILLKEKDTLIYLYKTLIATKPNSESILKILFKNNIYPNQIGDIDIFTSIEHDNLFVFKKLFKENKDNLELLLKCIIYHNSSVIWSWIIPKIIITEEIIEYVNLLDNSELKVILKKKYKS